MFDPRVPGRPETAPAYDALRVVKQMPQIDGCMQTKKTCICYTQQGTNAGLDRGQCLEWMANRPFNAYAELIKNEGSEAKKQPTQEAGTSLAPPRTPSPSASAEKGAKPSFL